MRARPTGDGGCAFPVPEYSPGMSLRDWFAGQVLAAIYANPRDDYAGTTREDRAVEAYRAADAMLHAREEATS